MPPSRRISSSEVATFPWTRMSASVSCGWNPTSASATSHAATSLVLAYADFRLDVGLPVIVVGERVVNIDRTSGKSGARGDVDVVGQPHVRKRLAHRHRGLHAVDAHEPLRGQEVEADVVECV